MSAPLYLRDPLVQLPATVKAALEKKNHTSYAEFTAVLHCVKLGLGHYCGVVGEPEDGSYEWFFYCHGKLETSDKGYGCPEFALRDVMVAKVK